MPGPVSDSYEAGVGIARDYEGDYDDIVTFGRVLAATVFYGSDESAERLLDYFEKPHKWETEYRKWLELGGLLDPVCLREFEDWYDNRETGRT